MCIDIDEGLAPGVLADQVQGCELVNVAVRCAAALLAADHPLLLVERRAVPRLDEHPYSPRHEICPAGHPFLAVGVGDPDALVEFVGVLGLDVACSVLEAEQISRRLLGPACRRSPPETQLRPADCGSAECDAR